MIPPGKNNLYISISFQAEHRIFGTYNRSPNHSVTAEIGEARDKNSLPSTKMPHSKHRSQKQLNPQFPLFPSLLKAVFALPVVKSIYPLLFLSTSPDGPSRILILIMLRSIPHQYPWFHHHPNHVPVSPAINQ